MPSFFFHYNKPATASAGVPMMTVHSGGCCHEVKSVVCSVPCRSRPRSRQPRLVMSGRGCVRVRDGVAYITKEVKP
jgi:hypothetical protein